MLVIVSNLSRGGVDEPVRETFPSLNKYMYYELIIMCLIGAENCHNKVDFPRKRGGGSVL